MKQYDDALALLANQVKSRVFGPVFGKVSADERLNNAFVILRDLKVLPGVGPTIDMCEILSIRIVQPQACLVFCQLMIFSVDDRVDIPQLRVRKI
jgi:hypothetical protein